MLVAVRTSMQQGGGVIWEGLQQIKLEAMEGEAFKSLTGWITERGWAAQLSEDRAKEFVLAVLERWQHFEATQRADFSADCPAYPADARVSAGACGSGAGGACFPARSTH